MPNENLPLIEKLFAAMAGASVSSMFLPGNWKRRLALIACGTVTSYYLGYTASRLGDLPETTAGFLVGLFSMAVADGLFRAWYALDLPGIASSWLRRK